MSGHYTKSYVFPLVSGFFTHYSSLGWLCVELCVYVCSWSFGESGCCYLQDCCYPEMMTVNILVKKLRLVFHICCWMLLYFLGFAYTNKTTSSIFYLRSSSLTPTYFCSGPKFRRLFSPKFKYFFIFVTSTSNSVMMIWNILNWKNVFSELSYFFWPFEIPQGFVHNSAK